MVDKFVPLPPAGGGKLRTLAVLERLARRYDVTLCAFDDGEADIAAVEAMGVQVRSVPWRPGLATVARGLVPARSLSAARFWHAGLAAHVRAALAAPPDVLLLEYPQLVGYVRGAEARFRAVDLHNVESDLVGSYAAVRGRVVGAALRLEQRLVRRLERDALGGADVVSVVSDTDRRRLPVAPAKVVVCPNGWEPRPPLPSSGEPVAAFVAQLGWGPNVDAALWLGREVWPAVARRVPGATLLLVGRDPTPAVRALHGPGIDVVGTVPEVEPYLARARVALAPLRAGGGSRLKVVEALGAARPVVATTVGVEGLEDLVGEGVVVADEPAALADAIAGLLLDPARAEALGRRGHRAVTERYGWDRTLAPLFDAMP